MGIFVACPRCARHVRVRDIACPFCALDRMTVVVAISTAVVACKGDSPSGADAAAETPTPRSQQAAVYGAPPPKQGAPKPTTTVDPEAARKLLEALGGDASAIDALNDGGAPSKASPGDGLRLDPPDASTKKSK
jgi:hypothetical protein